MKANDPNTADLASQRPDRSAKMRSGGFPPALPYHLGYRAAAGHSMAGYFGALQRVGHRGPVHHDYSVADPGRRETAWQGHRHARDRKASAALDLRLYRRIDPLRPARAAAHGRRDADVPRSAQHPAGIGSRRCDQYVVEGLGAPGRGHLRDPAGGRAVERADAAGGVLHCSAVLGTHPQFPAHRHTGVWRCRRGHCHPLCA